MGIQTDKNRLAMIEGMVWELRASLVAARNSGLEVEILLGGNFTGGPKFFNDLFDTVNVRGTRTSGERPTAGEFNHMVAEAS